MRYFLSAVIFGGVALAVSPTFAAFGDAAYQSDEAQCADIVHHRGFKTEAQAVGCDNAALHAFLIRVNFPWMDLQEINEQRKLATAQRFDARQITAQEALIELNQADADFTTALNQRVAAYEQEQAAQQQNSAAAEQRRENLLFALSLLGGRVGQPAQQPQPTYEPPAQSDLPQQTHCQWFGQQWQCTTY